MVLKKYFSLNFTKRKTVNFKLNKEKHKSLKSVLGKKIVNQTNDFISLKFKVTVRVECSS